ncbi:family methyltransferase [Brachionus plicatilis]|uniref:Family methyltransferase n=1 Tax=Brachionus plicatilis TaxID=10195 RepID=A0A3M7S445_BRAPC|nr:family methyltransferase [Brachionus plicatilis]
MSLKPYASFLEFNMNNRLIICFGAIVLIFLVLIYKESKSNFQNLNKLRTITILKNNDIDLVQNANDVVLKYINLPFDYGYGSNSIPLVVASLMTSGDLLELGMGKFSTPLLHKLAADTNKQVVSIDTDINWVNNFALYNKTKNHKVYCWPSFDQVEKKLGIEENKLWGIVLVDHINATQRAFDAKKYANRAEIVLIHDAEKTVEHGYQYEKNKIREPFKYVCKFSVFSLTYVKHGNYKCFSCLSKEGAALLTF